MKRAKRTKRAQRRKYHYIYKTTCIITNKFYIGMHSTDNLEDGYLGSGKRLWYSINKHGKDNHICEILEFLPDRNSLKAREKEIVNEELIGEELCMNLALGGNGGEGSKFLTKEQLSKGAINANKVKWSNPEFRSKISKIVSKRNKNNSYGLGNKSRTGLTITEDHKRKIGMANSIKQKRSKNSQYGTCWITNGFKNKKIKKGDTIPNGWKLGRKIK